MNEGTVEGVRPGSFKMGWVSSVRFDSLNTFEWWIPALPLSQMIMMMHIMIIMLYIMTMMMHIMIMIMYIMITMILDE